MIPSHKTFKVVNVKTGTVLDLSGADQQSVCGGKWNAEDTQKVGSRIRVRVPSRCDSYQWQRNADLLSSAPVVVCRGERRRLDPP